MSNYKPQKGDRVRVVLEGEVRCVDSDGFTIGDPNDVNYVISGAEHTVSVELVEPPVEVFKPGDTVRDKRLPRLVYTLGKDGYFSHDAREWRPRVMANYRSEFTSRFTSRYYERVELA